MILKIKENRVWRLYAGGKLLDALHGRDGADTAFPEDWLASTVEAINPPREDQPQGEGLSVAILPDGEEAYLRDLISGDPKKWLGAAHIARFGANFGVLTKFLDSAVQLPIQVHPDPHVARSHFQSDYGKTEAWYILETRKINGEDPYILMGFQQDVTPEQLKALFDAQDIDAMADLMHKIPVKPGEVYLIEGGTPHAIGPGCLLLEVQEPTDYTISLEKNDLAGEPVPDRLIHQGLGFEKMFDCFHYNGQSREELLEQFRLRAVECGDTVQLISHDRTPCFALRKRDVNGVARLPGTDYPYAIAVIKGMGAIGGAAVKQGDCLFVPAGEPSNPIYGNNLELLECLPPR